jgi:F-type H+-transporting ATPase subunit delta
VAQAVEKGIDVAEVYAGALLALASEANLVEVVRDELRELARLGEQDPAFAAFVAAVGIDMEERAQSLERMFRGRLHDPVLNTLQVMNRHGRLGLLRPLAQAYVRQMEAARGQVEVRAVSAVPLSDAQRDEVGRLAKALSGKQPLVQYAIDPTIIGGLIVQVGDQRLDNSIRQQLHTARAQLLARTTRAG